MTTIAIPPADLAVGDVVKTIGGSHVVAAVRYEDGNVVWTSDHEVAWNGKPAEYAIHQPKPGELMVVERAA